MGIGNFGERYRGGKEELRLSDLTLESEEKEELEFDLEKEITEEDKEKMIDLLNHFREEGEWSNFLTQAAALKITFPDLEKDLDLEKSFAELLDFVKNHKSRKEKKWQEFAIYLREFKTLFPDRFASLDIDDQEKEAMISGLSHALSRLEFYEPVQQENLIIYQIDMKWIFKEEINDQLLNNKVLDFINQKLEDLKKDGNFELYCEWATCLRILYPQYYNQNFDIDDETIAGVIKEMDKCRRNDEFWDIFTANALNLKVLIAERVEITDQGLKLVMPERKDFKEKEKPRPERKQF